MTKPFIVLGCPRSGTSLVAGILHQSGIVMADKFAAKTAQNPRGFFEDVAIVGYNDRIFKEACTGYLAPPPRDIEAGENWLLKIRNRLKSRARHGEWGWKDPRCIFLWCYYQDIVREEFGGAKIIATHRNPLHIARSWITYGRIGEGDLARGLWLVGEYEQRMAGVYKSGWPVLHVAFEDWWRKPDEQREALSEFAGRALNFSLFDESLWRS